MNDSFAVRHHAVAFAAILLSTMVGCTAGLRSGPVDEKLRNAMPQRSVAPEQPVSPANQTHSGRIPVPPNHAVSQVSHQQVIQQDGPTPSQSRFTQDRYPGVYEMAGFRTHICSDSACGCGAAAHGPARCGCGSTACVSQGNCCYSPECVICQFPGDPNEYLCDGGDRMPDARVLLNNDVRGLGLEDTVVHYETPDGLTYVEPSNRVCIYAPRFASVRKVTSAVTDEAIQATQAVDRPDGPVGLALLQPSRAVMVPVGPQRNVASRGPDGLRDRNRGVPAESVVQPILAEDVIAVLANLSLIERGILRDADKPWLAKAGLAAIAWSSAEGTQVIIDEQVVGITTNDKKPEELKIYEVGKGRVRLVKLADKQNALPGEFVHFVLRFDNVGDGPVDNVAILDNLTTRLEYVDGSQTCTKGAEFSVETNEGQSLKLRWALTETLDVGEGCVIRFKCKIR